MANASRVLSVSEMELMSPDERANAVKSRVVTDLLELPEAFRNSVLLRADALTEELRRDSR